MSFGLPLIYPITDTVISGLTHARQVELLAAGGATLIQLREKRMGAREFYEAALAAMRAAQSAGVRLIINDRVDVALAVGADGVHLGQDDLPPRMARALLGPDRIIGLSTHNTKQALEADRAPVDYLAIGPVFLTGTKDSPNPVVGLAGVAEISRLVHRPLVAIGGITLESASLVLDSGANSVAVISDLYGGGDVTDRMRRLLQAAGKGRTDGTTASASA